MIEHIIHENRDDSSSTVLVAVVVVLLILVVGWFAYNAGAFGKKDTDKNDTIDVNINGGIPAGTDGGTSDGGGTAY